MVCLYAVLGSLSRSVVMNGTALRSKHGSNVNEKYHEPEGIQLISHENTCFMLRLRGSMDRASGIPCVTRASVT